MRPRIPLAYAGLLIVALVAVVGFAAFSTGSSGTTVAAEESAVTPTVSARVASAILALRVSAPQARVTPSSTTTETPDTTTLAAAPAADPSTTTLADTSTTTSTTAPPKDTTPPALTITSPEDGSTVTDRVVTFTGTSEPGATVSSGPYHADVDDNGDWSIRLVVSSEGSLARITAEDAAGNSVTKSVTVTYDPPAPPPPVTTTTSPSSPPTTSAGNQWSPLWPADAAGKRPVEQWRSLVEQYWPADLVNCALNIMHFESYGNPQAYNSRVKAEGLFQHLSKYWKGRAAAAGFRDSNGLYATPYNAEANIAVSWYIAKNSNPWHAPWTVNPQHPNAPFECTL